jgi:protein arginine kinase
MKKTDINSLVVSSRVRFARNIENLPFKIKKPDVFSGIADTIKTKNPNFVSANIDQISKCQAQAIYEQHLISREFLSNKNGIIVTRDDSNEKQKPARQQVCVMLGEEDHIRIQVIELGMSLDSAYKTAKKISNDIEAEHKIAKSAELGYLTSCPTNLGTAMRASVMMFLPALTMTGQINMAINNLRNMRIAVRGVYGEGSGASGHMYQISNQACLEMDESEILKKVEGIAVKLANDEIELQKALFKEQGDWVIDNVMRSFGALTHAYMISSDEAIGHLAWLKFGDCLGIIKFKPRVLDDLFFVTKPFTLLSQHEKAEDTITRDKLRAKKIADILRTSRIG